MVAGVYVIYNMETNAAYVGSSINLFDRAEQHFHMLEENRHFNYKLQQAFVNHPDAFAFIILEQTEPETRRDREQVWLDRMKRHVPVYNIRMDIQALPKEMNYDQ